MEGVRVVEGVLVKEGVRVKERLGRSMGRGK